MDTFETYNIKKYIEKFFCNAKVEDIYIENLKSFLSWCLCSKKFIDLNSEEKENVILLYSELCVRYPIFGNLKPGYNHKIKHVEFNLEPIYFIHRPLITYIVVGVSEIICNFLFLRLQGFHYFEVNGVTYWYKQGYNNNKNPILMLHGISPGWSIYLLLINYISKDRTVVLVDLPGIKLKSMNFNMPTSTSFCDSISIILKRHRIEKVNVVGHSFGTITAGYY